MATAYIQESLCLISLNHIYLLKAMWTYQMKCISDNLGHMDKAGIFDCAQFYWGSTISRNGPDQANIFLDKVSTLKFF